MAYLVNQTRAHTLTINGTDYTDNLISFSCSDSTTVRAGIITTKGQIILGYKASGLDISQYRNLLFKRGAIVILDMARPNGTTFRHPRGYLYVISTSYNPDTNENTIEVGCRLALAELTNNVTNLLSYSAWTIPEEQQDFNNLSAFLTVQNKVLYQNNQGTIVLKNASTLGGINGDWTSILGQTAITVSPLSGSSILPDVVKLTYTVEDLFGENEKVDYSLITDSTTTYYELEFPVKKVIRKPPNLGVAGILGSTATGLNSGGNNSNCGGTISPEGNDPTAGRDNDTESCSENFTVEESVQYIPAENISISSTYNTAIAGQTSKQEQEVYGPALEVQSSYFTDKYNYCVQKWSSACTPWGFCAPEGSRNIRQGRQVVTYDYNSDGSLSRKTTENYRHILAAAQPQDWRAITLDTETGEETEEFRDGILDVYASSNIEYLDSLQIEDIIYNRDDGAKSVTTTYTSLASRGIGISSTAKLDARTYGIKTIEIKVSATRSLNPFNPDRTNNSTQADSSNTTEITIESPIRLFGQRYTATPPETNPYELIESLPLDLNALGFSFSLISATAAVYLQYIKRWIIGEALGLRITETLRPAIVNNWEPSQYFFYTDPASGEVLRMQMDACSWAVSTEGSAVTMAGLWTGESDGTLVVADNLVGNGAINPPDPSVPETNPVTNVTNLNEGGYDEVIDIRVGYRLELTLGGIDGSGIVDVWPKVAGQNIMQNDLTTTCYVTGFTAEPGNLYMPLAGGGIPLEYNNTLLTANSVIIDPDIFS